MINSKVYFDDPSKETWITVERFDGNELKGMDSQLYLINLRFLEGQVELDAII